VTKRPDQRREPTGADHRTDRTGANNQAKLTKKSRTAHVGAQTQEHRDEHRPAHNLDGRACGMCTTIVIFGLIVAAVLTVPALARILGAAVLILLALIALAYAEERQPVPVPSPGGSCPVGWTFSPTSRMCAPSTTMRCRAVRRPAGAARQGGLTRRRRGCASRSGAKIAQLGRCTHKITIGDSDLIDVRFGPLCGPKSDIPRGPRSNQHQTTTAGRAEAV
jgi:hypothetical protein